MKKIVFTKKQWLLIAWIALCTGLFIYLFIVYIDGIKILSREVSLWKERATRPEVYIGIDINDLIKGYNKGIIKNVFYLLFTLFIYTSFIVLAVQKFAKKLNISHIENRIEPPAL